MALPSLSRARKSALHRRCHLTVEQLEDRTLLAAPLSFGVATPGTLAGGATIDYDIQVLNSGEVLATLQSSAPGVVLSLVDSADMSNVLVQSVGVSGSPMLDVINQQVPVLSGGGATDYLLQVQNTGSAAINYTLQATFTQSLSPLNTLPLQLAPNGPVPGASPCLVVGDFNGDGVKDIAVAQGDPITPTNPGVIQVFLGNGDGSFQSPMSYAVGPSPVALVAANFQPGLVRLGNLDLAAACASGPGGSPTPTLWVLTNQGDGTFVSTCIAVPQLFSSSDYPTDVVAGDFNGDGSPDLAVVSSQPASAGDVPGYVSVYQNTAGSFTLASQLPVDSNPLMGVAADFDGSGRDDLVTANFAVNSISILRGIAGPNLLAPAFTVGVGNQPIGLTVGNFNGDGLPDLAVADFGHTTAPPPFAPAGVSILFGTTNGSLLVPGETLSMGDNILLVVAADFNGDGRDDLAAINNGHSTVTVALNNGDGTFGTPVSYAALTGFNPAGPASLLAAADFSGDGVIDLVTASTASYQVDVLQGKGDGTFTSGERFSIGNSSDAISNLLAVDVTGDGHPDILTANFGTQDISILRDIGNGQFVADPITPAWPGATRRRHSSPTSTAIKFRTSPWSMPAAPATSRSTSFLRPKPMRSPS